MEFLVPQRMTEESTDGCCNGQEKNNWPVSDLFSWKIQREWLVQWRVLCAFGIWNPIKKLMPLENWGVKSRGLCHKFYPNSTMWKKKLGQWFLKNSFFTLLRNQKVCFSPVVFRFNQNQGWASFQKIFENLINLFLGVFINYKKAAQKDMFRSASLKYSWHWSTACLLIWN